MKPEHGIIILEPYASAIKDGIKLIEYRNYNIPKHYIDTPLFLLSGGRIFGVIKFTDSVEYSPGKWQWYIQLIKPWHHTPKYNHPNGAQRWVRNVNKLQTKLL